MSQQHDHDDKAEWEDLPILMKVYLQIPYAGSEFSSPSIRALQASPKTEIKEEIVLSTLTQSDAGRRHHLPTGIE
jgi:hypothetical protein